MEKKKTKAEKKVSEKEKNSCTDKFCPIHGLKPLKLRGRIFKGTVIKKLHGRITIQFERMNYVKKYERYEKRKTKLHARLPNCLEEEINVGDYIKIAECRPLSKIIHFVVVDKVKKVKEGSK